jgi:site-specific recombinase XerD
MSKIDDYIHAATRDNTRRSYQSAVRHFETEWGGFLPSTADSIARYLVDHAQSLSVNTLRHRLAALAQWHIDQGFPDPTKAPVVRKVLKGIQTLHPVKEKRAKPFQLQQLEQVVAWLDTAIDTARRDSARNDELRHSRDKALVLLGFWRGFRGNELTNLQVQYVEVVPAEGMTCFFPQTKGDRQLAGTSFKAPALSRLCPVAAYTAWITLSGLTEGPVFRAVNRWGELAAEGLHPNSLVRLLRTIFDDASLASAMQYSGHSLRRGFANWATANGWDIKTLMEYVGWKDVHSAMRYLDSADPFSQHRIESMLVPALSAPAAPVPVALVPMAAAPTKTVQLHVTLSLEKYSKQVRTQKQAHKLIEEFCMSPHRMKKLDKDGHHYQLTVACESADQLEETVLALLDEMHRIASSNECFLEASVHDTASGTYWN